MRRLELEARWAAGFDRVVWFVASDERVLRARLVADFDEGEAAIGGRRVLVTESSGMHTRRTAVAGLGVNQALSRDPRAYAKGVAEAISDWWLLGEADLAVIGSYKFPSSASSFQRTAFARGGRSHSTFQPITCVGRLGMPMPSTPLGRREYKALRMSTCSGYSTCSEEAMSVPMWGSKPATNHVE